MTLRIFGTTRRLLNFFWPESGAGKACCKDRSMTQNPEQLDLTNAGESLRSTRISSFQRNGTTRFFAAAQKVAILGGCYLGRLLVMVASTNRPYRRIACWTGYFLCRLRMDNPLCSGRQPGDHHHRLLCFRSPCLHHRDRLYPLSHPFNRKPQIQADTPGFRIERQLRADARTRVPGFH